MLTPEEKVEIETLKKSPYVKLATETMRKSQDPEKKRLYQLRWLNNKGKKIAEQLESELENDEE